MLELFFNTQTKALTSGLNQVGEFILPPFYAGETRLVRLHVVSPSGDPLSPSEIQASSALVSLNNGIINTAINAYLSPVNGQLYLQGALVIPATTGLLGGSGSANINFSGQIIASGDTIFFQKSVTINSAPMSNNATQTTFTRVLGSGDSQITINYATMGLTVAPTYISINNAVQKTADGQQNIYASLVVTTITNTSATVELNAPCDVSGRSFNFTVIP